MGVCKGSESSVKKLEKVTFRSSALSGSVEAVEGVVFNSGMDILFLHKDFIWAQKKYLSNAIKTIYQLFVTQVAIPFKNFYANIFGENLILYVHILCHNRIIQVVTKFFVCLVGLGQTVVKTLMTAYQIHVVLMGYSALML